MEEWNDSALYHYLKGLWIFEYPSVLLKYGFMYYLIYIQILVYCINIWVYVKLLYCTYRNIVVLYRHILELILIATRKLPNSYCNRLGFIRDS